MPGVALEFDLQSLGHLIAGVDRLGRDIQDTRPLMDGIAALLENQTKRRIADEKTDPTGKHWAAWSPEYAATRAGHHSLLIDTQNLLDSIAGQASDDSATVGTEIAYGAVHQYGWPAKHVPARPYLGVSDQNSEEIQEAVSDWLRWVLAA